MRLELSRRAQADLDDIHGFSVERFGPARAILYIDEVEHAFRRILNFPQIGALLPDLSGALRSLPVGEHRLYYSIERETLLIVRVLHEAMDPARHL